MFLLERRIYLRDHVVEERTPISKEEKVIGALTTIEEALLGRIRRDALNLISAILKVSADDIDLDEEMSVYGFDSISITKLTNQINDKYKLELTPAIFFEHSTLGSLTEYLLEDYRGIMADHYKVGNGLLGKSRNPAFTVEAEPLDSEVKIRSRFVSSPQKGIVENSREPIAIIGMSGKMPQSENLEHFGVI